jgi:LDH2 family malate/lactate/ureidoglycolate dehydrogenase
MQSNRHSAQQLFDFTLILLKKAGLNGQKAQITAETLLEADLLGHRTHGLQLLEPYLAEIEKGTMRAKGQPKTLSDKGAVVVWNGRYLPGPWYERTFVETRADKKRHFVARTNSTIIRTIIQYH